MFEEKNWASAWQTLHKYVHTEHSLLLFTGTSNQGDRCFLTQDCQTFLLDVRMYAVYTCVSSVDRHLPLGLGERGAAHPRCEGGLFHIRSARSVRDKGQIAATVRNKPRIGNVLG